jgi:DEAD/DEAH box helicase domain-containing protein
MGDGSPATAIGLRSAGPERVMIQTQDAAGTVQIIGEIDRPSVPLLVYPGAVYLHEGASYLVDRLDWGAGVAYVHAADVDFYTQPSASEKIEILTMRESRTTERRLPPAAEPPAADHQHASAGFMAAWGDVRVISQATGYRILRRGTHEVLGFGQIDLPEQVLETQACWLSLSEGLIEALKAEGLWLSDPNDYGPSWPAQRDAVRARDGYRCQGCGRPESGGRQHDVHHKIPFRAFVADPILRLGLAADLAWQAANRPGNLVTLCPACHHRAEASVRTRSGLGGGAALLVGVAPLFLMCDPRDLSVLSEPQDAATGRPTITLYEKTPGGVGYAEQIYASLPELLRSALDLVAACPCEHGCPACVGPVLEHEYALDAKALSRALLERLVEGPSETVSL